MNQINFDKDLGKIISSYRTVSTLFFKGLIYICFILLSFLIVMISIMLKGESSSNDIAMADEIVGNGVVEIPGGYAADRISFGQEFVFKKRYNISILGGYVVYTGGKLSSYYNFISIYNNGKFILPYNFIISKTDKIPSKRSFTLDSINQLIDVFILGNQLDTNYSSNSGISIENGALRNQTQLKSLLNDSISQEFDLSCMNLPILSPMCAVKVRAALSQLPTYNLSKDNVGISDLFEVLKKNYKSEICDTFVKYNNNSGKFDDVFRKIYSSCGDKYLSNFERAKLFNDINTEFRNGNYSSNALNDNDFNAYKLLSMQRMIHLNDMNNNDNTDLIKSYLDFLQNLSKYSTLEKYYFYEGFVYNNGYLTEYLNKKLKGSGIDPQKAKELQGLLDSINNVNNGNSIFGISGLISYIDPSKSKDVMDVLKKQERHGSSSNFLDDEFKSSINAFKSDYIVFDIKYNEGNGVFSTKGAITIKSGDKDNQTSSYLYIDLDFKYKDGKFQIIGSTIKDNSELDHYIKTKINTNNNLELGDIIGLIRNYNLGSTTKINLCDLAKDALTNGVSVDTNNKTEITSCTDYSLHIKSNNVDYTFNFDDNKLLSNFQVSDANISIKIHKYLDSFDIFLKENFIKTLPRLLNVKNDSSSDKRTNEIILIVNKMQKYLQTSVSIGTGEGSVYNIEFSVNGILFAGLIDPTQNYRVYNLSFKDGGPINNFSLNLMDVNQFDINKFKVNTLAYLAKLDPEAMKKYLKK